MSPPTPHARLLCRLSVLRSPKPNAITPLFSSSSSPSFHSSYSSLLCSSLFPTNTFSVTSFCRGPGHRFSLRRSELTMPQKGKGKAVMKERQWVEKTKASNPVMGVVADGLGKLNLSESSSIQSAGPSASPLKLGGPQIPDQSVSRSQKLKSYASASEATVIEASSMEVQEASSDSQHVESSQSIAAVRALFQGPFGAKFIVDNQTYARAQIRATFYPKFENEKSDQEVRTKMIEMVCCGLATLEVSLKHSGSLFMYAGHAGGAYAKNSFGNVYTAVGVFVLGRMFLEAWGTNGRKKQSEFNNFLEKNRMCVSMELVTAVLGDHGQRPLQDYVVVTAVTELGSGKPKFYSTPDIIAFCRKWRLPTNHLWLFSTRKSVTSFFAVYDTLCEEGTATPVCKALDEVADIAVHGSKDHMKAQGEILEGLVARIVSPESPKHMAKVLNEFPLPTFDEVNSEDLGASLREICAANRADEKQQIRALLQSAGSSICPDDSDWFGDGSNGGHTRNNEVLSKFLQSHPSDFCTTKLQEQIRLMRQRHFSAAFKCYPNYHKFNSMTNESIHFKMVIHVFSDSVFRRYQQEMRRNRALWPLYRGFFVDINLFKAKKEHASELASDDNLLFKSGDGSSTSSSTSIDDLADEEKNLMIKLKFLTYKLRTFLIRNGLSILFRDGPSAYKTYYMRQLRNWGTSQRKQRELSKLLDEWAIYIRRKCGNRQLPSSIYLTEAEPFLEQYATRSLENQALIGAAGNLVRSEDFLAIVEGKDEEGDLIQEGEQQSLYPSTSDFDTVQKDEGLIVFFPGIPGCAKSALCKELLNEQGGLGDNRPVHSLMGDLIKGKYWQKVMEERRKKPYTITLADKNAPNEEVWKQIEDMCHSTKACAVPVIPDSDGTDSNPFSLDALAVFIFRVLQRVNHPGNLDKSSPNAGYVLLMFYHLYEGKNRREFENELIERFGALVRMPLLNPDRGPLPEPVKTVLKEGMNLYRLHMNKHGRSEPSRGTYAKEWARWEKQLRHIMSEHADYLNSIQVPFNFAVRQVLEQLKAVAKCENRLPSFEKRKLGNIVFAAVTLPVTEVKSVLNKVGEQDASVASFLKNKDLENNLRAAHVTLAHKRSHGVAAVASYGVFVQRQVPVELSALLFSENFAAFEARLGSVDGEQIKSKNQWPHVTVWTALGTTAKEANTLPQLVSEGKATRVLIDPPVTLSGTLGFF